MPAFRTFASLSLAALLGSGAALAQTDSREKAESATNPHSTLNKDQPASDVPAATTADTIKAETQKAEAANPHSTLNKDRTLPADGDQARDLEQAEKGNPHSVKNRDQMMDEVPASAQAVLERIATADRGEVALGKLAQENGSKRVQEAGAMLEKDHGSSLSEVQALAKKKSLTLSATPMDAMARHETEEARELQGKLAKLHGADFDKAFVKAMADDHRKDIEHLKKWQAAVGDKDVSALIAKTLPVLEHHLAMAQSLRMPAAQGRTP